LQSRTGAIEMLYTIVAILLVLWLVGLLTEVGGGLIHLLLAAAVIVLLFNIFSGRGHTTA